ncbi:CGNR zinc finger domain-containing protein [Kribbella sp. DT2]|uniref:CGNR zinc finger domain-containing protein n=1 Tax=Kribbella sp. DT2 TaxID=3393427 RepID=UPI003CED350D
MESLLTPNRLVGLAVDLVNTRTLEPEKLTKPADLRRFLLDHGEPEPVRINEQDLIEVREVRELIRPVFHAGAPGAAETTGGAAVAVGGAGAAAAVGGAGAGKAAGMLNGLLAEYAVRPYLSDHDGTPWHLHVARPEASWAEWLAAGAALGLSGFAAAHGFGAIGVCAAGDCERVFVNPAARRPRRFCTPTCASRTRVASHRARRATS